MLLDSEEQLKGLPESIIEAAAHTAKEKGKNGWIITLQAPSYVPFMKYCENRELRRKLYMAYNTQCIHDNEQNNEDVVKQLVNLRMQLAQLLGLRIMQTTHFANVWQKTVSEYISYSISCWKHIRQPPEKK